MKIGWDWRVGADVCMEKRMIAQEREHESKNEKTEMILGDIILLAINATTTTG